MSALSSLRLRFRRAVERGDPRLGLIVGLALSVLVAAAFAAGLPLAQQAENAVLDAAFRWRPRIAESDRILNVDMDDTLLSHLGFPIKRKHYAQLVTALDRLGARQIVFDVEFKINIPRAGDYDDETGEFRVDKEDLELRAALERCGRVTLAHHIDAGDPLRPLRPHFGRFKEALAADVSIGEEEIARRTGLEARLFREDLELLRHHVILALGADRLAAKPETTFLELRQALLPRPTPDLTRVVQHAYWVARTTSLLEGRGVAARIEGLPPRAAEGFSITPPLPAFAGPASDGGFSNAEADPDGVLRRPWVDFLWRGKPHFYLGFMAGLHGLTEPGEKAEVALLAREVRVDVKGADGAVRRSVRLPLDEEGRLLVSWAGNRWRNRKRAEPYFAHLPFLKAISFYDARYVNLDASARRIIEQLDEEVQKDIGATEYLKLSDRLKAILQGAPERSRGEARGIEARLDEVRARIGQAFERDNAVTEAAIPRLIAEGKAQVAKRTREALDQRRRELEELRFADRSERELRKIVEGKVCLIGSVYTASGDLHSTPLGVSTPGVDLHANVANMLLTGQSIRRSGKAVNFAWLLAVGLAVSLGVAYGNTAGSAIATVGLVGASAAVYAAFFMGASILIPGAGPAVNAVLTFAGVTAFKELVTQRSRRKLQRELEKNTSPELVKILMEHPEFISRPRKMAGTFFFSDVKSFTSISEKMSADVLVPYINRYLDRMTRALKRHQAFVDKYIGDGIMALFGVPVASADHARNACLAALDCQAAMRELNAEFAREGLPQIQVRIGIHSGDATAGSVGAVDRSNYTVLGDAVNLASRLEGANKEYGSSIMVSESTWDLVRAQFAARELDRIRVVGKRNAVRIFELLAPAGAPLQFSPGFLGEYEAALQAFRERRWEESIVAFGRALALVPGDRPSLNYVDRARAFLSHPPPADWEGVFDLHSK